MFLVLSFDFENSSSVNLHCMTNNMNLANNSYTSLLDQILAQDQKDLLELVEVQEEFVGSFCFYWGQSVPGVKILRSNNRN